MNLKFHFPYPPDGTGPVEEWRSLYEVADNKLVQFLAYVARALPNTQFLVYSRGTGGKWELQEDRDEWVADAVKRFPELRDRITTMYIAGGVPKGTFKNEAVAAEMRKNVKDILRLEKKTP